jgi:hypothetical protein
VVEDLRVELGAIASVSLPADDPVRCWSVADDLVRPESTSPQIAAFDAPLGDPNLEDARIAHTLAPLADMPVLGRVEAAYRQRFRLKSWQYMTAVTDELFIAFVAGTAGFASNGFVYAVELATGKIHKKFAITPLSIGVTIAPTSVSGGHRFRTRGLDLAIESRNGRGFGTRIEAKTDGGDTLSARLDFGSAPRDEHLATCVPLPGGRWSYTHKFMAFAVSGEVAIGGNTFQFRNDAWGTMDFTKQYALRHSVWKWVALCGRSKQGAVVGVNLVDPTPDAPISENAAWIDGTLEPLAEVRLSQDPPHAIDSPWTVEAASVDLRSRAIAHVEQKLDVPLVRHRLCHVVSAFSGMVRTKSGHVHDLDSIVGIAEDNDTLW